MKMDFELSKPFLPFEQLLAVLPAASKKLIPEAFHGLILNENSPIIDFYPTEFEQVRKTNSDYVDLVKNRFLLQGVFFTRDLTWGGGGIDNHF